MQITPVSYDYTNQKAQNRPNFGAWGQNKFPLTDFYRGLNLGPNCVDFEKNSSTVEKVLKRLAKSFEGFFATNAPRDDYGHGANTRIFMNNAKDKVVLSLNGSDKPIVIQIDHSNGSESYFQRNDWNFDPNPTESDDLFDKAVAVLMQKLSPKA